MLIFETQNFILESVEKPHIPRLDGGHLKISPKQRIRDRTLLSPQLAIEMTFITMLSGETMTLGLKESNINIGRINYQDNGNWSVFKPEGPYLHIHLYGRAKDAKINKYGDACHFPHIETGFYNSFAPLNKTDIKAIQKQIDILLKTEK